MALPTLAERVGTSFAAWERRGRGWMLADYPVSLEPPFRTFFLLPEAERPIARLDDGRHPTLLSTLAERVQAALSPKPAEPESLPPFEEQAPFPATFPETIATRRILIPEGVSVRSGATAQLLSAWLSTFHPVSFELVGRAGRVALQVACADVDAATVFGSVTDFVPEAVLVDEGDLLAGVWDREGYSLVVDFGYADEFFLPLPTSRAFAIDPFVPLVSALARAEAGETFCYQVLVERAMNPWREAIRAAVLTHEGKPLFVDAPEFVPAAKEKTASLLCACAVRVGVQAESPERVRELMRGAAPFVRQYAHPTGNALVPLENDGYAEGMHTAAFLARQSFRTGMIVSLDELVPLVHVPDDSVHQEAFERLRKRTKALPAAARGHDCVLGENLHRGAREPVTLSAADRLKHTVIVGGTGTGKSTLLVNLIRQDMERGDGCAVLDPHGDLIDDVLAHVPEHRLADVVLFDPADEAWPVGFNVLSAASEHERSLLASDLVGVFRRLSTSWGDGMSTVLANAVLAVLEHPEGGTLLHLRRFLIDEGYRKTFLARITDPEVRFFWTKEWSLIGARSVGPILTRLNAFLRTKMVRHIVAQRTPKLDFASVIGERKIFLGKLSQGLIGNENAYLLGSLLLSKFLQLALSRQRVARDEREPFWLYLDEAEHFVTPSVASILTEARKYGVGLHLSLQMLSQLKSAPEVESAVMGSAHTRIVFRVGDDDARRLEGGFSSFAADDLKSLATGEAIARIGDAQQDCNLTTTQPPEIPVMVARDRRERIVDISRARYASPLADVAAELAEFHEPPGARAPADAPEPAPTVMPEAAAIPERQAPVSTPAKSDKRHRSESRPAQQPLGKGGPEHRYLQHLIQRLAEERGFRAVIEEPVEGGSVDVALRRGKVSIACEVSVSTDATHELGNMAKCVAAGFGKVWLVVADKKRKEPLAALLAESSHATQAQCLSIEDLVEALDSAAPATKTTERIVGGYKVKVSRKAASPEEQQRREAAIAEVVARSLVKGRKRRGGA
ncbi:MAG: type IV secretion system DNA-binding domain-containing protein [Myxococcota bacterium]|nr:type IV secretion system DNA-binding domain-containing protein [Myxococcota bacterium]